MPFPDETLAFAKWQARAIKAQAGLRASKLDLARGQYNFHDIKYGFAEGLRSGIFARYPHEIQFQAECLEQAVREYVVARELGLNPKFINVYGWGETGFDGRQRFFNQSFILADVGKKEPFLIDKLVGVPGYVTFSGNEALLRHPSKNLRMKIHYDSLEELSEEQIIAKLEYLRTPEGSLRMLEEGQSMGKINTDYGPAEWFVAYRPSKGVIESHVRYQSRVTANAAVITSIPLSDDEPTVSLGIYEHTSWIDYVDFSEIANMPLAIVSDLARVPEVAKNIRGNKSQNLDRIIDGLLRRDCDENTQVLNYLLTAFPSYMESPDFTQARVMYGVSALFYARRRHAIQKGEDHEGNIYSLERHDEELESMLNNLANADREKSLNELEGLRRDAKLIPKKGDYLTRSSIIDAIYNDVESSCLEMVSHRQNRLAWYRDSMDRLVWYKEEGEAIKDKGLEQAMERCGVDYLDVYMDIASRMLALSLCALPNLSLKKEMPMIRQKLEAAAAC